MSTRSYDVIVAGGGNAGVAAAVAAARTGARTLLIERYPCLGGAATMRNIVTYCGLYTLGDEPRQAVGGIANDVLAKLRERGAITPPQRHRGVFLVFDPESLKSVLDELCADAGVEVVLNAFAISADREGDRIACVVYADHGGLHEARASAFVDCTGEGDLMAFGGAACRYGNEQRVNLGSLGTRFGGIPADVTVTADDIAGAVARIGAARGEVTKDRGVMVRLPISGDLACYLASEDYDPRDAASQSRAESAGRRQAWRYLEALRSLPGCESAYLVATGPEFGTRESRHIEARRQLLWSDVVERRTFPDCIALGAWGAEWHHRDTYESEFEYVPDRSVFEIPLSCLVSRDTDNLFAAGRLADGDRKAGAAVRVMGTALATGQAAGIASALQAGSSSWDHANVRQVLDSQGAVLEFA